MQKVVGSSPITRSGSPARQQVLCLEKQLSKPHGHVEVWIGCLADDADGEAGSRKPSVVAEWSRPAWPPIEGEQAAAINAGKWVLPYLRVAEEAFHAAVL
jgi:hypothetical protein